MVFLSLDYLNKEGPMTDSQDSKKCILSVAAKLFARLGLDKTSTREIAKESNSNISLISYYFGGKEGLYKEVMRQYATEVKEHILRNNLYSKSTNLTREHFKLEIFKVIQMMVYFHMKYPEMAKIFSREKLAALQHSKEIHEEIFYPLALQFIELVESAQKEKIVKSEINPAIFFILIIQGISGFFEMRDCPTSLAKHCGDILGDPTELAKQISQIYIEGVLL